MAVSDMSYHAGANMYYLMQRAADTGNRKLVTDSLDAARAVEAKVIRTWAFNDGQEWNALQPKPGVWDENVFKGLDFVLDEARKRGIKLVLTLSNYWKEYGGFPAYVMWSKNLPQLPADGCDFYGDAKAVGMYLAHVEKVLTRVNSISKVAYKDDPTIMAWDLVNEPRYNSQDTNGDVFQKFLQQAIQKVKSIDAKHPVTIGCEGFFGTSTKDLADKYNPWQGTYFDFMRVAKTPGIDLLAIHVYADQWFPGKDAKFQLDWTMKWIEGHIQAAKQAGKPLVLQEVGWQSTILQDRVGLYQKVFNMLEKSASGKDILRGVLLWMLASDDYPDWDGYTLYNGGEPSEAAKQEMLKENKPLPTKDTQSLKLLTATSLKLQSPAVTGHQEL